ncbi:MAG: hypothetical protein ABJB74_12630 [Gemmatimonas sp.]
MSIATLEGSLHRGCGGRYSMEKETVTVRLSGMAAEVDREYFRCDKCGHDSRTIDQREAAEKLAVERIRAANSLLTPRGIRQLRDSLGLTVAQFSELCYGTPKGIVEGWEKGRYLQNRDADALMRSLSDRATLERRAAKAGVTLPVLESVGAPANASGAMNGSLASELAPPPNSGS